MNEFDIISKYFAPLTMGESACADLKDDAAVLLVPPKHEIVVSTDTLNSGIHFLKDESPENIARKSLRMSLSDLAASGANPLCYQLSIAYPQRPEADWLESFTSALLADQKEFGIFCSGGDTTSIHGSLSISVTVIGSVPTGSAVRRGGAKDGDNIVLSGFVGDAALGLKSLWEGNEKLYSKAVGRYRVPESRINIADMVRKYANAAIDISDGFLADISHIAKGSALGADIYLGNNYLNFSTDVRLALESGFISLQEILCGGDDYELIMAVPQKNLGLLIDEMEKSNLKPQVIGGFKGKTLDVSLYDEEKKKLDITAGGWQHF